MRRKTTKATPEASIEAALRNVTTIGQLEELAGIDRSHSGRAAFWKPFAHLPGREMIDAGCTELRRLAREKATVTGGVQL